MAAAVVVWTAPPAESALLEQALPRLSCLALPGRAGVLRMTFDRIATALNLILNAIAVADRAEPLWQRARTAWDTWLTQPSARDRRWYAEQEARFQQHWPGVQGDLR